MEGLKLIAAGWQPPAQGLPILGDWGGTVAGAVALMSCLVWSLYRRRAPLWTSLIALGATAVSSHTWAESLWIGIGAVFGSLSGASNVSRRGRAKP